MKLETNTVLKLRDELMARGKRETLVLSSAYESLTAQGLLSAEETATLGFVDPIAEAMFLMMNADGTLAEEEMEVIRGAIRDLSEGTLRSGTIKVMIENYARNVAIEGWEQRLRTVAEGLREVTSDAETAYALVAAVALADQEVTLEENELIDRFSELLGIDDDRCAEILSFVKEDQKTPWDDGQG